jgi:hypothetical protein
VHTEVSPDLGAATVLAYGLTQVTLAALTVGAFYRTSPRDRALTTLVREASV